MKGGDSINIAICDDQTLQLDILTQLLDEYQNERKTLFRLKTFQSAYELLDAAENEHFDLYLLDVMMHGIDGITVARDIRNFDNTAGIIYLTSSPNFAYESYSVHAFDYLLKPVQKETFFMALDRFFLQAEKAVEGLTLKCGNSLIRIPFKQLVYVEVNGKHLYFNMTDGTEHKVYGFLKEYANILLERPEFMQIHRSYIVNMYQAAKVSADGIKTFTGKNLPVSRLLYPQIQKDYMNLMFTQRRG